MTFIEMVEGISATLATAGVIYLCKTFSPVPGVVKALTTAVEEIKKLVQLQNDMMVKHKIIAVEHEKDIQQLKKNHVEIISSFQRIDDDVRDVRDRVIGLEAKLDADKHHEP